MLLGNIYTIKNQDMYKKESLVMILAHLLNYYDKSNFNEKQFIILDNGLYEGSQVSTNLQDLVDMADGSGIPISEIVIPDVFFDKDKTLALLMANLDVVEKYKDKYSFMVVAQSHNINEFKEVIDFLNTLDVYNLSVGIPKRAPFDRESEEAIEVYKTCKYPIHFLGLTDSTPLEKLYKAFPYIRSCDTSQISTAIKNGVEEKDLMSYRREEGHKVIDLKEDYFPEEKLNSFYDVLNEYNFNYLKNKLFKRGDK